MHIGFIGLGKLGLDCAEVFAEKHTVKGYDISAPTSHSVEICSAEETICASDWIFVAVPTPHQPGYDGSVPSSHMEPRDFGHDAVLDAIAKINQYADRGKKVVLISTVLPGTTRRRFVDLLDQKHQFVYNPYLIAMGSVKWDMVNPEMVMIGTRDGDRTAIAGELIELYQTVMQNEPRYVVGTWEECEAIKIFYNTFISAKVGLANMIQDFAMKIGHINVDVVTDALAQSTMRIMGPKYMTAGMGDAGACHPRDNIALRWLAQEYDLGYDIFDTIMRAREIQARNLAYFLIDVAEQHDLTGPIVIHGKAYKPDVPYCIGSYSTLVAHYIWENGIQVRYLDPMADDSTDVVTSLDQTAVILMAHNRHVTYGYTGHAASDVFYCAIPPGSVLVDPWRALPGMESYKIVHYGNTRAVNS
jgi:UDPglucose 6-dehydrogenase